MVARLISLRPMGNTIFFYLHHQECWQGRRHRAGAIASLEEPTAAAVAYGLEKVGDNKARNVLIIDLYSGTFSVTFLGVDGGIDFVCRFCQL